MRLLRAKVVGFPPYYLVTRNRRPLSPRPWAGEPESVITLETWTALEIHNSVPSLHLSSPPGPAPLGSFIFVLMAALDNGAAEKSQKAKTQLWHYWPSLSSRSTSEYSIRRYTLICSLKTRFGGFFFSSFTFSFRSWNPSVKFSWWFVIWSLF